MTKQELKEKYYDRLVVALVAYEAAVTNCDDDEYDAGYELFAEVQGIVDDMSREVG